MRSTIASWVSCGFVAVEVGEELDAEGDVALLVDRDVAHPLAEAGQQVQALERRLDQVLAGLGERALDDDVVERHGLGERPRRVVGAQLVGHPVQAAEDLAVAPGELVLRGAQAVAERAVADADDLVHPAMEEDRVARLVDLLRGEEVLLLLQRRGVDVRREVVGDGVLAVEEQRVEPQRAAALLVGEVLVPVDPVLREVDVRRRPVAALPARVEVGVVDLVGRGGNGHGHGGSYACPRARPPSRANRRGSLRHAIGAPGPPRRALLADWASVRARRAQPRRELSAARRSRRAPARACRGRAR